jgi:hypothetical protein
VALTGDPVVFLTIRFIKISLTKNPLRTSKKRKAVGVIILPTALVLTKYAINPWAVLPSTSCRACQRDSGMDGKLTSYKSLHL